MKTLSLPEFNQEPDVFRFADKIKDIGLPAGLFIRATIKIASSLLPLLEDPKIKSTCFDIIQTNIEFMDGARTLSDCFDSLKQLEKFMHDGSYAVGGTRVILEIIQSVCSATTRHSNMNTVVNCACSAAMDAAEAYSLKITKEKPALCILKECITWEQVCATQIVKALGQPLLEERILAVSKNQELIDYTTVILSQENLRKEFEFIIQNISNKEGLK